MTSGIATRIRISIPAVCELGNAEGVGVGEYREVTVGVGVGCPASSKWSLMR